MRIIGHLDMDAFFAAVEERDNPRFKGLSLVVGADPMNGSGRGVVSTANYAARRYGIHSAMPISKAWDLAKAAEKDGHDKTIFLKTNGKRYGEVSARIMEIIRRHVPLIEEASVDEAYMDLSFLGDYSKAKDAAKDIKQEIKEVERLTASIGIGPNKLIAKIASDRQKPDGLTVVPEREAESFLAPLSIRAIPGIGPKTEERFNQRGFWKIGDLKQFTREEMVAMLGKWGVALYDRVRGKDESPIVEDYEAKSVGEQETFLNDTKDPNLLAASFKGLCLGSFIRLKKSGFKKFKTVVIIVRFADFTTLTRRHTLDKPSGEVSVLEFEVMKLFMPFLDKRENPKGKAFRLLGVRLEGLS